MRIDAYGGTNLNELDDIQPSFASFILCNK